MDNKVRIMLSNRHIHITEEDKNILFGNDYELQLKNQITPTIWATKETVKLVGPRGEIDNVRILMNYRKATQVEVLKSDCFKLGITAPIRQSGDVEGSASLTVVGPAGEIKLKEGVIIAARHIHMDTAEAEERGIKDKDYVMVRVGGERALVFENVWIRVKPGTRTVMHIDTEEGNACNISNDEYGEIIVR